MRTKLLILVVAVVLLLVMVSPVAAITNGQPDAGRHPYVGLLIFDSNEPGCPAGGGPCWRCSGSLIAPNVVLTAGHCTDGAYAARVWFAEVMQSNTEYPFGGSTSYEGLPVTNPKYRSADNPYGGGNGLPAFSYRDTGVVVLSEPVPTSVLSDYAELPTAGLVDSLKNKTGVDFVGYGVSEQIMKYPGQPPRSRWGGPRNRMYAPSELVSGKFVHSAEYMRFALNPGGGSGGTCFGDSGGPDLLGGTNTVLAVNSYVTNVNCGGVGYSARVDIPEVLEWINGFLSEP